jgi:hypothetical protein
VEEGHPGLEGSKTWQLCSPISLGQSGQQKWLLGMTVVQTSSSGSPSRPSFRAWAVLPQQALVLLLRVLVLPQQALAVLQVSVVLLRVSVAQLLSVLPQQASATLQVSLILPRVSVVLEHHQEHLFEVPNHAVTDHWHAENSGQPVLEQQQLQRCSYPASRGSRLALLSLAVQILVVLHLHLQLLQLPTMLDSVFELTKPELHQIVPLIPPADFSQVPSKLVEDHQEGLLLLQLLPKELD